MSITSESVTGFLAGVAVIAVGVYIYVSHSRDAELKRQAAYCDAAGGYAVLTYPDNKIFCIDQAARRK